ncbi:2-amino-4-hydroxy-6-hydroxymethyldihydropteridine diphosphokinase [Roseovarius arcticus]|uniref:2-amino-4-hydroxy-6- hydroxymethyldihydropteridine diphosphokinase n=1 Tax=Roseovarius arcticus TaxID=2547404 RepID=UPI001110A2C6|nr:2-amino-4-hydroxy-6-hydroxymethyldihydropteridine diphosphokinase [Roseovarius arcticus]
MRTIDNYLIALGGNLPSEAGSAAQTLSASLKAVADAGATIHAFSPFYTTPCFPVGAGPDYVNAAANIGLDAAPDEMMALLHRVEALFGRTRVRRWGRRTLDLDLLACGAQVLPDATGYDEWRNLPLSAQMERAPDQLILPHPRLHERAFVLVPLADVAPDWQHPVLGRTVREMVADLPQADVRAVQRLA